MSTRFEWFDAASVAVDYIPPGHYVDNGEAPEQLGPNVYEEYLAEQGAIVISGDEAVVLHGSSDDLRALALRILAALPDPKVKWPTDEVTSRIDDLAAAGHSRADLQEWVNYSGEYGGLVFGEAESDAIRFSAWLADRDDEVERALDEDADMYFDRED